MELDLKNQYGFGHVSVFFLILVNMTFRRLNVNLKGVHQYGILVLP